ncbi:MAG TPA: hypothetical protein VHQ47_13095 [Phycisphaerae bacterium]|nr:hypothetical protein [Phycisphaerae bacterium]
MSKHVVFDDNGKMKSDLAAAVGTLQVLVLPEGLDFHVEVEMPPELEKALTKDPLLLQKMHDQIGPTYKKLVASLADDFKKFEVIGRAQRDEGHIDLVKQIPGKMKTMVEQQMGIAKENATKDALGCYDKYLQSHAEYKKYKIKVGATITGAVAGLAASIASAATGAFTGGFTTVMGIIGLIKSAIVLTKEIASALLEVEEAFKVLQVQMAAMEKAFLDAKGKITALGKVNEAASIVLNQFIGIAGPNIKNTSDQVKTVKAKTQGIDVKSHALAQTLNKVLKQSEVAENEIVAKAAEVLHKRGIPDGKVNAYLSQIKSRLNTTIMPLNNKVMELIGKIGDLQKRVQAMEAALKPVIARYKKIEEERGKGFSIFELALSFSDIALVPITAGVTGEWASVGRDLLIAEAQWGYEKLTDKAIGDVPL